MRVLFDLLSTLEDAPVRKVCAGIFWTAVTTRATGLASTVRELDEEHGGFVVADAGALEGKSGLELAQLAFSESTVEASIGVAAINSLLKVDESLCREVNAAEVIAEKGTGKYIAVVGHFPFVEKLRKVAREVWVLEKRVRPGDLPAERAAEFIPRADVVAITGTTLINHTFDSIIGLVRNDAFVIMVGPSTPLSPLLFEYRLDALAGSIVVDEEEVFRKISQGAILRQLRGLRQLVMFKEMA